MSAIHSYKISVEWTGNLGKGTSNYRSYERSHNVNIDGKSTIQCSSDPAFRGDKTKHNPEELFLSSIATCHMLWYLHLCSDAGIIVTEYNDDANGTMTETEDGGGRFTEVILHPHVVISDKSMVEKALQLHTEANKLCFIANSCNFKIQHKASCEVMNII